MRVVKTSTWLGQVGNTEKLEFLQLKIWIFSKVSRFLTKKVAPT